MLKTADQISVTQTAIIKELGVTLILLIIDETILALRKNEASLIQVQLP